MKVLGKPNWVCVFQNEKEWAIKAADELEEGSYLIGGKPDNSVKNVIRHTAFLRAADIPFGYVYKGRLQDEMIIFSKKPAEKA